MTMPAQKPHRSVQDVGTDPEFLPRVVERFGEITLDLAATADNFVGLRSDAGLEYSYCGPGAKYEDALAPQCSWITDGLAWLNPPFGVIMPWAKKAAEQSEWGARIALLVPASVGANWFNLYVRPYAYILELTPRLTFVGHKNAYPKDLILAYYSPERLIGRAAWDWKRIKHVPANDNGVDPRQMRLPIIEGAA